MALSRLMNFIFWVHGYSELGNREELAEQGVNVVGYAVLLTHVLQLLLMADFLSHYVTYWLP